MSTSFYLRNFLVFILGIFLLILLVPNNIVLEKIGIEPILYDQIYHFEEQLMNNNEAVIDIMTVQNIKSVICLAVLFGVILAMIIFNVLLAIRMHNKKHSYAAILFTGILLFQLSYSGVLSYFNQNIAVFFSTYKLVLLNVVMASFVFFSRTYLNSSYMTDKVYRTLTYFVFLPFIALIFFFIDMIYLAVLFTSIFIIFLSLYLLKVALDDISNNGSRNAKFFTATLFIFLIGGGVSIATEMGYLDFEYVYLAEHGFLLACDVGILIISYSLTDKLFLLHQTNLELKTNEHSLALLSLTDDLTKLYNRRYFNERLKFEVEQAHNSNAPLTLLLVDIDYFKNFNDTYGHHEGDKALAKLGKIISENIRQTDYACRYGGEEFGIIMPNTSKIKADKYVADRLHNALAKSVFAFTRQGKVFITVSIGICELHKDDDTDNLLEHADQALYKAKSLGRNRTVMYQKSWANEQHQ